MKKEQITNALSPDDFLPTLLLKAKNLAMELTCHNVVARDLKGEDVIVEHMDNNLAIRNLLIERGVTPELLPPEEDLNTLKGRIKVDEDKIKTRD